MRYLKKYNEDIFDSSGSMADKDLIDYNISLDKLRHDFEVYAEDLPFEMSDIKVEKIPGIKLGASYWYYEVTFNYNKEEMNNIISRDYIMKSIILDGYVDLSDESVAHPWINQIKEQCDTAMAKFARKYDLDFAPVQTRAALKVLINMDESDNHNIKYTALFKKRK